MLQSVGILAILPKLMARSAILILKGEGPILTMQSRAEWCVVILSRDEEKLICASKRASIAVEEEGGTFRYLVRVAWTDWIQSLSSAT